MSWAFSFLSAASEPGFWSEIWQSIWANFAGQFLLPLPFLLILTIIVIARNRRHERSLREREAGERLQLSASGRPPDNAYNAGLITANLVYAHSSALVILIQLRKLFGGRIYALESVMARARRELVLRLEEKARNRGYDCVYGIRFDSASLGTGGGPSLSMEMTIYGTAAQLKGPDHGASTSE